MAGPCVAAVWERSREVPFPFAQPIQRLPKITNLSRARSNPLKERCFCCISVLLARRAGWPCGKVPNYCATAQPRCSGWKPLCCRHCFPHAVCPWHTLLLGLQEQHVHWHWGHPTLLWCVCVVLVQRGWSVASTEICLEVSCRAHTAPADCEVCSVVRWSHLVSQGAFGFQNFPTSLKSGACCTLLCCITLTKN